ncbi:putative D-isomer specific 2-hydroxyacid dehydrogenase, NAD binding domain containing protein [Blattamonas nauphoetae]|uniref:D-isomer specific 2-hydroxyacid dehydrogenase, NAD binding domain containing protein n=1 Tax=Blattamonas nauphoetae TaxID=2049346 RepID=A0ABQ9WSU2_9EUKA|nr:putative D-isomer specific 2-hydroxyacid dehydrogenase, NAD binding domain containing protein [Blattamonas nauphoetae]
MDGVRAWKKEGPAVRKRGQQILAKLCEEGLSDEIELHFKDDQSDTKEGGVSLVDFVKEGHDLDERVTRQACSLLEEISPSHSMRFTSRKILFELVPTRDRSCSGFTNSMITLLTSSNEDLVKASLFLLEHVVDGLMMSLFDILASGFFSLLPQTFYEHEIHLSYTHYTYLMDVVIDVISCSHPEIAQIICEEKHVSTSTFRQTFMGKFFHPIKPNFSRLLQAIIKYSPFLEEMTLIQYLTVLHLQSVMEAVREWKMEGPAVQKRGQQILSKLCETGLSEEIELHLLIRRSDRHARRLVFLGAQLIQHFGTDGFTEPLSVCKPSSILVNVGRGTVISEAAVCSALNKGFIRHAILDVFEEEPLPQTSALLKLNPSLATLTPHVSGIPHRADFMESLLNFNIPKFIRGMEKDAEGGKWEKPYFLRTDPESIKAINEASRSYLSLVDFIKEGNKLSDKGTRQACALLHRIENPFSRPLTAEQLFSQLVPTRDGSCSGFTNSMITLLTSSNEELIQSTLSLLSHVVGMFDLGPINFDFLASGFFSLLPQAFYEQDMHLSNRRVCQPRHISKSTYQRTFMDKFFHPIEPFLDFVCRNRRDIADSDYTWTFSYLLESIVDYSTFQVQMTQFLLSSLLALTLTDFLLFIETDKSVGSLLWGLKNVFREWKREHPAVRKRGQQILSKLREEGISDEFELYLQNSRFTFFQDEYIFIGARVIHTNDTVNHQLCLAMISEMTTKWSGCVEQVSQFFHPTVENTNRI